MKKVRMLAAMLTLGLVLAMAVPAIAQVSNTDSNSDETGDVSLSFSVQSKGNNSSQCVTPLQFANTGSNQNSQSFLQYESTSGKLSGSGGTFSFTPTETASCTQPVQQSSAASSD